jgi:hypothetical protein
MEACGRGTRSPACCYLRFVKEPLGTGKNLRYLLRDDAEQFLGGLVLEATKRRRRSPSRLVAGW